MDKLEKIHKNIDRAKYKDRVIKYNEQMNKAEKTPADLAAIQQAADKREKKLAKRASLIKG